jgi:hypothetical protein
VTFFCFKQGDQIGRFFGRLGDGLLWAMVGKLHNRAHFCHLFDKKLE